jgi:signal transduction histidine kinase/ligand-binding sensor domain-containing protein/DNA-binding response OmpR family regulator
LLGLISFMSVVDLISQEAANHFRRIDSEWGLSNNQINTIFSDSRGFVWFATVSGLNRYDGYNFKVYKNIPGDPTSLPENSVQSIYEDHLGYLWLFTTNSFFIYDYKTETFGVEHELFSKNIPLPSNYISTIRIDSNSNLWISSSQLGLYFYDVSSGILKRMFHDPNDANTLSSNRIMDVSFSSEGFVYALNFSGLIDVLDSARLLVVDRIDFKLPVLSTDQFSDYRFYLDSDDDIWLYSLNAGGGLYYLSKKSGEMRHFNPEYGSNRISSSIVSGVLQDNSGYIWVGTDHGGINIINKSDFSVMLMTNVPGDMTSLSGNSIRSLHKSEDGIIWVGTFKNGINYYHEQLYQFKLFRSQPFQKDNAFYNDVNCFAEDKDGNLWIGTNGDGLVFYDRKNNTFRTYRHNPSSLNSLSNNVVVSLCVDHQNRVWAGTYQGGLNCFDGRNFKRYKHNPEDSGSLSDNRVWNITEDSSKRLWVGTLGGGLDLFDERSKRFVHHRSGDFNSVDSDFILALMEDRQGNLWIGTSFGLNMLDTETRRFRHFAHDENNSASLSHNNVLSLLEDVKGRLWVGTRNGLNLLDRSNNTFQVFRNEDGLPDHNIISLQDDGEGNLWIATLNGLSNLRINEETGRFDFRNYDLLDGLQGMEFNEHSSLKTSNGELIFGGANGFNMFHPGDIWERVEHFPVVLTDFRLQNRSVGIGEKIDGRVLFKQAINITSEISLRHNQNIFSIEFSALNYFHPERTRFLYMLEGFNPEWIETDSRNRTATYTNLNPGTYVFRVKASGSDGTWSDNDTRLVIEVVPPFYATGYAYLIYFVFFVGLIVLLVIIIKRREKMKFIRNQEHAEFERMRDLDAMKIRFFTNVSHEFRTPLTLILTPVEKLLKEVNDSDLRGQLVMIQRNGKRLLNLVNQLLDFRKMEVKRISINLSYGDIARFAREAFESFSDLFESKNIRYEYKSNVECYNVSFDYDKVEKILFNLLSNAVKFTPENGAISLEVNRWHNDASRFINFFEGKEYLEFIVCDNGIGIREDRQEKIFERFFQGDDNSTVINQGSGIGLALTLEFVRMHGGTIHVDSKPGDGSTFTVRLPLATELMEGMSQEEPDRSRLSVHVATDAESQVNEKKPVVLIVEDNEDLRFYLKENLKEQYSIIEAPNGAVGWGKVVSEMPRLVVSDIMMPVEDGISLCKKIKSDNRTSHIPVILLSARISNSQKLEGLEAGADDYITKPFNYEILELKIRRLIEFQKSFQKEFARKFEIKPGEIGITSLDEKFLQKALKLVEKNIGNSEFSVEKMGKELGVSRGHLYNKLLALTGKTPMEFIRVMRLKRAAQLLGKSQLTVSEIAFQVGFNEPKYFSRYFKEEFGVVPSEYAKNCDSSDI